LAVQTNEEATVQLAFDITQIPLELDSREGDGITVSLLWRKQTNVVTVALFDQRTAEEFEVVVSPDRALDAFHHPYAYAADQGLLAAPAPFEALHA
jgi:hypothetical protein